MLLLQQLIMQQQWAVPAMDNATNATTTAMDNATGGNNTKNPLSNIPIIGGFFK